MAVIPPQEQKVTIKIPNVVRTVQSQTFGMISAPSPAALLTPDGVVFTDSVDSAAGELSIAGLPEINLHAASV